MELLLQEKADPTTIDFEGATPLHCAAFNGHENAVSFLLNQKPSLICVKDKTGSLPVHNAACSGNENVVSLLVSANNESYINVKDSRGNKIIFYLFIFLFIFFIYLFFFIYFSLLLFLFFK